MKKNIQFGKPIIGEQEQQAVMNVLKGPQLVHGPKAKEFENYFANYIGANNALSVASCTSGLHLAYVYFGIGPGDEVIIPAQTHVATAHAVEYTGAKPVFVDIDIDTGNIDIEQIEQAITSKTKAICVVHYLGLPVDMDKVNSIARKNDLFVIEDAALAVGATYKGTHVGLLGDMGSFSFYPVKHITTAEGGMFVTRHDEIAEKVLRLKSFGYDKLLGERIEPGLYDVDMLGYNYRMNELEAALGIEQVKRLPDFLTKRRENSKKLRSLFNEIDEVSLLSAGGSEFEHANYCMIVILDKKISDNRFDIIKSLRESGVGTSIYYPGPVPHLSYYKDKYDLSNIDYPNAERISNDSIALPVGPHLESDDIGYIADMLKAAINEVIK